MESDGCVREKTQEKVMNKGQSRIASFVEACINILIGYSIAVIAQTIIFPIFGILIPFEEHLMIGLFFTVVSIIRSYSLRRLFNMIHVKFKF